MTEKTIDPIFAPSVLEHAMAMFDDVNFRCPQGGTPS